MPETATEFTYTFNGRKNEWNEYVVRCYKHGKRYSDGDYHTDDKTDAQQTFNHMKSNG